MPQVAYRSDLGYNYYAVKPEPEPEPLPGGTLGAAFRIGNPTWNFLDYATRPRFTPDPAFNLSEALKKNELWDDHRFDFLGVSSEQEFTYRASILRGEQRDRETLARSGWTGIGASVLAGAIDPTILLPLTAGGTGLRAVGEGALLAAAGAGASESVLQLAQVERPLEETAFALGTATVLGGLLGGAVGQLHKPLRQLAQETDQELLLAGVSPNAVGAAATKQAAGGLKGGTPGVMSRIGPVTSTIDQETSPQARWMMQNLADAGLKMERNIEGVPTALGGTVEDRVKTWYAPVKDVVDFLDNQYAQHWFGDSNPRILQNQRAKIGGYVTNAPGKLSKAEFRVEIARALRENDEHVIPEVAATAKHIRERIFDPMLEEAQKVGMMKDAEATGDLSYLQRDYNHPAIARRFDKFVEILARNFDRKLSEEFQKKVMKLNTSTAKDTQRLADMKLGEDEAEVARKELADKMKEAEEGRNEDVVLVEDTVSDLRSRARLAKTAGAEEDARKLYEQARELEKNEPRLPETRRNRAAIRQRLKNLSHNKYVFDRKFRRKLEKIDEIENAQTVSLERLIRKGRKLLTQLDTLTDEQLNAQIDELNAQFDRVSAGLDKTEAKLFKELEGESDELVEKYFFKAAEGNKKLDTIFSRVEEISVENRQGLRSAIQEGLDEATEKVRVINNKRAERLVRMRQQAEQLDTKVIDAEIARIEKRIPDRAGALREVIKGMGGENIDLEGGSVEFGAFAKERAQVVANKIQGTQLRLAGMDIIQGERGPELARLLDIPSREIEEFLENDVEKLIKKHVRTLAPDIELSKKFGNPNAVEEFAKLTDEYNNQVDVISSNEKLTQAQKDKRLTKLDKEYKKVRRNLEATIGRLRHTWGLPQDPESASYRLARVAINLNVARLMGGVTINSVADVARPIQKYGLVNTFRDGFLPLITNFKTVRMSHREAQLAGTALDVVIHTRAQSMFDVMDEFGRGSKGERALEYVTSRVGLIALFDYWTVAMKQLTASVANAQLVRGIQDVMEGRATAKQIEFLASVGIDSPAAQKMWAQIQSTPGGGQVNGVWLPNTEAWTDLDAQRAYRAALAGEIDDTIITPGVERPLWVDKTTTGRLVAQFRSFALSSTTKTLMAGLQERDAAFVVGSMVSLSLGALSYYLWAVATGGNAYEEMINAGIGKWADESIDRSGILGVISEGQRFAEKLPLIMQTNIPGTEIPTRVFAGRFSESGSSRAEGQELIGLTAGPSFDLGDKVFRIATGIDDPTKSTLHQARLMMPYQNLFYFRQILDYIEAASADAMGLPERRQ